MFVYLLLWRVGGLELRDYPEVYANLQAAKSATGYEAEEWLTRVTSDGVTLHEPSEREWPAPMVVEQVVQE